MLICNFGQKNRWSNYCGRLFVGHSTAENLVEHFHDFQKSMNLDPAYLLYLGIDGPSVNKSFEDKLLTNQHTLLFEIIYQVVFKTHSRTCCFRC